MFAALLEVCLAHCFIICCLQSAERALYFAGGTWLDDQRHVVNTALLGPPIGENYRKLCAKIIAPPRRSSEKGVHS